MAHFSEQVHITIGSFSQNVVYYDLKLSQKMADHHHFSFIWQYTGKAIIKPADQAKALRSYLGDEVIFTFKSLTGIRLMSKGIITELSSVDLHGSPVGLHVTGVSHSIVLDDMKKTRTYQERTMDDIVLGVFAEGPGEFYQRDSIKSTYSKEFKNLIQYNESSFEFLKRISARYGQWFYFDGMRMQFGQTKTSKVKLINGASLHSFKIQTNMTSHKISLSGYDYKNVSNFHDSSTKTSTGSKDSFSSIVTFNQGTIANSDLSSGVYTANAYDKEDVAEMVTLQTSGSDANSVFYSGISYFPIGLGQVFTIVNQTVEHELIAVEVIHHSEVHGNYSCEFKAIPADVSAPHYTNVHVFANATSQPAKVRDNNDPEGLGRLKVQFYGSSDSAVTEWIRMVLPYAGSGKGFYFIPEIGEEVLVGFEGNNVQNPYVMGAKYNGNESSGYGSPQNDIKAIHTRSGIKMIFNDEEGSVLIEDMGGSTWKMDGKGNINVTAAKDFTIDAGDNITITAGKNISVNAGDNIDNSANKSINQSAGQDLTLLAGGNITEEGDKKTEIIEGKITASSVEYTEMAEKISINTTKENLTLRASKTIVANSGEISSFN
ncbi:type IV secretion protein Rhs [Flavobacterium psychroterrae]|uniref:Type IV secretion protein Rhs n=1 Tax=Flavobacterium psychroterrae TaxID=2133767 RepID=A0ABS5PA87_9FLAO|nr:phage baseplate assembly protein V [Flavobacterium psychroterrae]MBS7231178.1 type IV secretion protein Rhs [Flavobacterium psychroterrae]